MILVGNQRGGARDLARHLMKDDNERVTLHDIRGFASDDLLSAFQESQAVCRGTKCKQHLFSLSLNPPQNADVSDTDFEDAIGRAERALGLEGQPRAIVFHEKIGDDGKLRRHAHSVWCRVDVEHMKAVQLSFTKTKLQNVARDLYRDHGWQMPRGFVRHEERDPRNFSLQEWQQCKRAKRDPAQMKEIFQDAWAISDSGAAFSNALEAHGLILARGDRRGHIAVDHDGEAYAVARYAGLKAKQVRDRLGASDALPSKDDARQIAAQRTSDRLKELQEQQNQLAKQRLEKLRAESCATRQSQAAEMQQIDERQKQRSGIENTERQARVRTGLRGLLNWVTGRRKQIEAENRAAAENARRRDATEQARLAVVHQERREETIKRMKSVSAERKTTNTDLAQDIERLNEATPAHDPKREAYKEKRRSSATRTRRQSRARDGPSIER